MERDAIKEAVRNDWEAGLTFKALSQRYNIPEGTIKSWAKREGWKRCNSREDATESMKDATTAEKVASETEQRKYDWEKLKTEYLTGEYRNLKEFAELKQIPYNGYFFNNTSGWPNEKKRIEREMQEKIREQVITKTTEKASDEISDFAIQTAKTLLEVFEENQAIERTLIAKLYQKTDQIIEEMNQKQVVTKRKKKATVKAQIPANLNIGGQQLASKGDLEFIQEEVSEDIDVVVGIMDYEKYEAVTRGLERIQRMNRIAYGIERLERREDRIAEREERLKEKADKSRAAVLGIGAPDGASGEGGRPIIVEFGIPRPDWSQANAQKVSGETDD